EAGVAMRRTTTLTGIEPARVNAENEFGEPVTIAADAVVLVTQRVSRDRLYHELDGTLPRVHRIGDCVAPRILAEVVFDGHRLARGRGEVVVAAGRGAGDDLEPYRRLAERYGGRFAVSRPQVEASRATRAELVGASSQVVAPEVYLAFGISGAIPHLVGMA